MKYLQILTVDNEYFSINLDQQIYIRFSADGTEVSFLSETYLLVFTTDKNSPNEILINQVMMDSMVDRLSEGE
jgi:hypothetical protein